MSGLQAKVARDQRVKVPGDEVYYRILRASVDHSINERYYLWGWEDTNPPAMRFFADPVRANIRWDDIEAMLIAFGATIIAGKGSRRRIALNGVKAVFHRPHPEKETDKGAVKSMRRFLPESGHAP